MSIDPIRQRWRNLPSRPMPSEAGGESSEVLAGNLFRAVPSPRLREPQAVSNLFAELRERRRPLAALRRVVGVRPAIRRVAVVLSVFLSLNMALALSLPLVRRQLRQWLQRAQQPGASSVRQALPVNIPAQPVPVAAPPPGIETVPKTLELSADAAAGLGAPALSRHRHHAPAPIAVRETTAEPSPPAPIAGDPEPRDESLAGESQLLSKALAALSEGQPTRALAALALYQEKYPHGSMSYEAALAQMKAEIASNQLVPALAALDRAMAMPGFEGLPRSSELTLLRAELLAQSRRCAEALPTLDRLAREGAPGDSSSAETDPSFVERALYVRASCLASEGDAAGSRASLQEYLRRFPNGRFAAAVRTALAK